MSSSDSGSLVCMRVVGLLLLVSGIDYFVGFLPAHPLTSTLMAIGAIVLGAWGVVGALPDKYAFILRIVVGATFVYAAIDKIVHPDQFAKIIYYYKMMPGDLINLLALLLPWIELISGILLIVGFWEKASAVIIAGLLVVFLIALTNAFLKGIDISCGCFSTTTRVKGEVLSYIFRDIVLIAIAGMIVFARKSFLSLERSSAASV